MSSPWGETFDSFGASTSSPGSSGCHLTPAAGAFTAILSAFIGSVINGLTNGWMVAFMTGWIAWLAIFRVLVGGLYMFYHSITDSWGPGRTRDNSEDPVDDLPSYTVHPQNDPEAEPFTFLGTNQDSHTNQPHAAMFAPTQRGRVLPAPNNKKPTFRQTAANIWPPTAVVRRGQDNKRAPDSAPASFSSLGKPPTDLDRGVTALGWFALAYTALWAPITQLLFVVSNASRHEIGAAKLVKGLTTAVTALPLCIDCRVRYADALKWPGARYALNVMVSVSCLLQGAVCATLLITGWLDLSRVEEGGFHGLAVPRIVPVVYVIFALFWMFVSFAMMPMRDGGRQGAGKTHWAGYIMDVGVGAFAGVFLAAPALILYFSAVANDMSSGPSDLADYLRCERQAWRRFAAVAP